jgi:hypothetical protein
MSLERLLEAAKAFGAPEEPIAVMIVQAEGRHAIRVIVGREVVCHVDVATTREEAVARALDELDDAVSNLQALKASVAFAEATSW